jgi:hypothetical protein
MVLSYRKLKSAHEASNSERPLTYVLITGKFTSAIIKKAQANQMTKLDSLS